MHSSKWSFVSTVVLVLITRGCSDSTKYRHQQQKEHLPIAASYQSPNAPPYWEYILREFVFKTISPPPPGNNALYKRLLDAPFYGGPFPFVSTDESSVVLSRGDVYYLPNDHWMLCQEGCIDCEVCAEQKNPTVKWILRRIKRLSSHGPARYDLQLTIIPQIDGSYHMKNLWPRSYVYVTSPGEQAAYSSDKSSYHDAGSAFTNLEDSFTGQQQRSGNFWRLVEKDSVADRQAIERVSDPTSTTSNLDDNSRESIVTTGTPGKEETPEYRHRWRNVRRQRPRLTPANAEEKERKDEKQVIPRLILGTDQRGQKHLVHLVPAEYPPPVASFTNYLASNSSASVVPAGGQGVRSSSVTQDRNKNAYQRVLRRILDSLQSHRRSIENFLEPSLNSNRNQELTRTGTTNEQSEEHQQEETRNGFAGLKLGRGYDGISRNRSVLHKRWPAPFNWGRLRRKTKSEANVGSLVNDTSDASRGLNNTYDVEATAQSATNNSTVRWEIKNRNVSEQLGFRSLDSSYREKRTFNNTRDISRVSNRELKFASREFKAVVPTESIIKNDNKKSIIKNRR